MAEQQPDEQSEKRLRLGPGQFAAMAIAAGLGGISVVELIGMGGQHHPAHPGGGLRLGPASGATAPTVGGFDPAIGGSGPATGGFAPTTGGSAPATGASGPAVGGSGPATGATGPASGSGPAVGGDLTAGSTAPLHTTTSPGGGTAHHGPGLSGASGPLADGGGWQAGPSYVHHHGTSAVPGPGANAAHRATGPFTDAAAAPVQAAGSGTTTAPGHGHHGPAHGTTPTSPGTGPAPHHQGTPATPFATTGTPAGQGDPGYYTTPTRTATPEEIQAYMLNMTPEERRKYVLDQMQQNHLDLTSAESAYQPDLSPGFWEKPTYDFHGQTLNVVSAAATAYAIAGQLGVNITDLGKFALDLDDLSNKLLGFIGPLYDAVNRANAVFEGDENLTSQLDSSQPDQDTSFYGHFKAITFPHRDSAFNVVTAISPDEADSVRQAAAAYWHSEETNLAMLGTTAKDPRSAMDQARWKWDPTANNGKGDIVDQSDHYPGWYFDTGDPRSPFYKKH